MPWFGEAARRRRIEAEAYAWVVRIDEDRAMHEPALRRWIGTDHDRAEAYNHAYRAFRDAAAPAAALYGGMHERRATAAGRGLRAIPYGRLAALAAAFIILGFVIVLAVSRLSTGGAPSSAPANVVPVSLTTNVGEVRTIRLKDGTEVTLDTNTRIAVNFDARQRSVTLLQGRARFDVAHDQDWPFVVLAGGGSVTARGTVFDVDLRDKVAVHLLSGAIDVRYPTVSGKIATVQRLTSGQKTSFTTDRPDGTEIPVKAAQSEGQWVTGMETFDDVPVSAIIEEANRYSTRKILLEAPDVASREIFVDIDIRNTSSVARKLASLLDLRVDVSDPAVFRLTSNR